MTNATTTRTVRIYPKTVVSRTAQLAVAHRLAERLGLSTREGARGEYEAYLYVHIRRHSLKGATRDERNTIIQALERDLAAQRPLYSAEEHERIVNAGSVEELLA